MESIIFVHPKIPESSTYLQHYFFIFGEAHVAVFAQLKVGPILVNFLGLAIYCLGYLLRFMMSFDHSPRAKSFGIPKLLCATLQDVEYGRYILGRSRDELVLR